MTNLRIHNQTQRRYFEGTFKQGMVPADTPYLNRQVDEVLRAARLTSQDRVLEVGCGMGRYTLLLARRGIRVEGFDLSPVLLDRLREYDGGRHGVPLHAGDIADPSPDLHGEFDALIGFFALHHMHDLTACFRGMARLLRPGGKLVFLEPNAWNPLYYVQILVTPRMTWQGDKGIVNMRRRPVFAALNRAGFTAARLERFGFFPPFVTNRPWGATLEGALERVPIWGPILPFQLFEATRV